MKKLIICILAMFQCFAAGVVAQQPAPVTLKSIDTYYKEAKEKGLLDGLIQRDQTEYECKKVIIDLMRAQGQITADQQKELLAQLRRS
jgi:hypothetical protein